MTFCRLLLSPLAHSPIPAPRALRDYLWSQFPIKILSMFPSFYCRLLPNALWLTKGSAKKKYLKTYWIKISNTLRIFSTRRQLTNERDADN